MDGGTNSQCRNIAVVALDRGHSRVTESTRLTSEGGYPGSASDYPDLLIMQEHKNTQEFRVIRAAGA